jgi:hypothetical protein
VSGINPNGNKYTGMLALNQEKDDFKLTWWIGKDAELDAGGLCAWR